MPEKVSIHCFISGKVQGVWFRASAKEQADKHGITGFARNLADGRVEVVACGEKEKVTLFHAWLKQGPALAEVTEVTLETLPWQSFEKFTVL